VCQLFWTCLCCWSIVLEQNSCCMEHCACTQMHLMLAKSDQNEKERRGKRTTKCVRGRQRDTVTRDESACTLASFCPTSPHPQSLFLIMGRYPKDLLSLAQPNLAHQTVFSCPQCDCTMKNRLGLTQHWNVVLSQSYPARSTKTTNQTCAPTPPTPQLFVQPITTSGYQSQ
jgi:hypothetical protein